MKLQVPFVQLPVQFDAQALQAEVAAIEESCWRPHPQGFAGNSALTLIAVGGDPDSDEVAGPMRPTPWLERCPLLMQVMDRIGATWGRSRLMRLSGQAEVTGHVDTNYYWRERVRVHVPILTTPSVRFMCGDAETHMRAGECWIFDTWRMHRVVNADDSQRIHLVADTVGGDGFWDLVAAGASPAHVPPGWTPERFEFRPGFVPDLDFESVNLPMVLSPWELREHAVFLLGEAQPHPQLGAVQQALLVFARRWQALWACYGEDQAGWPRYRALLEETWHQLLERGADRIKLRNGIDLMLSLNALVFQVALGDRKRVQGEYRHKPGEADSQAGPGGNATGPAQPGPPVTRSSGGGPAAGPAATIDRPVFIVSAPRSGSTLLFETLSGAPGLHTIGSESHQLIEGVPGLSPVDRGYDSNRLLAADATGEVVEALRNRFLAVLHDRDGRPPAAGTAVRMLEKTPKNALRIPFLRAVFPDARFIYLHRDPRQVLSSMIEGWQNGRFRMYRDLPGWTGLPWSFLLVPGWRELIGKPLGEIVAAQWQRTTQVLLDDLGNLEPDRWIAVDYARLLENPRGEVDRLCQWAGLPWDRPLGAQLPLSQSTMSRPDPDKWRRHADMIEPQIEAFKPTLQRVEQAFGMQA
jgi:hypothetical protein